MSKARCAAEGCEDKGFLLFNGARYCDGHYEFRKEQAVAPVDHSAGGNCDCYPQCAKAAAERPIIGWE